MSRLKPQRIKSTELGAEKEISAFVTRYEVFHGITKEGREYEEDRVYFAHNGTPAFLRLNHQSLLFLASRGLEVTEDGLIEALPQRKLTFKLITGSGPYPFYVVTKIGAAKRQTRIRQDNSDDSPS